MWFVQRGSTIRFVASFTFCSCYQEVYPIFLDGFANAALLSGATTMNEMRYPRGGDDASQTNVFSYLTNFFRRTSPEGTRSDPSTYSSFSTSIAGSLILPGSHRLTRSQV